MLNLWHAYIRATQVGWDANVVVAMRLMRLTVGGALAATSTLTFRGMVHTKVNAVVPFRFIDKKIFQNVLPVCWGKRFLADSAMNRAARKVGIRTHTDKLIA